ncbi:hypothetical protein D3C73_1540830 [compost metagenome]
MLLEVEIFTVDSMLKKEGWTACRRIIWECLPLLSIAWLCKMLLKRQVLKPVCFLLSKWNKFVNHLSVAELFVTLKKDEW